MPSTKRRFTITVDIEANTRSQFNLTCQELGLRPSATTAKLVQWFVNLPADLQDRILSAKTAAELEDATKDFLRRLS